MKLFENKPIELTFPAGTIGPEEVIERSNYAAVICDALVAPRQEGYTFKEQEKRLRIIKALRPLKVGQKCCTNVVRIVEIMTQTQT